MELMKQPQYSPLTIAEMAVSLYAANEGYLDEIEVNKVGAFESALHSYMKSERSDLMDKMNAEGDYAEEIEQELKKALDDFVANQTW